MARILNYSDFQRRKRLTVNTNTTPVINAGDALRQQRASIVNKSTAATVNANDAQRQQRGTEANIPTAATVNANDAQRQQRGNVVGGEVTSSVESFNNFQRNSRIDEHLTIEAQLRDTIASNSLLALSAQ